MCVQSKKYGRAPRRCLRFRWREPLGGAAVGTDNAEANGIEKFGQACTGLRTYLEPPYSQGPRPSMCQHITSVSQARSHKGTERSLDASNGSAARERAARLQPPEALPDQVGRVTEASGEARAGERRSPKGQDYQASLDLIVEVGGVLGPSLERRGGGTNVHMILPAASCGPGETKTSRRRQAAPRC